MRKRSAERIYGKPSKSSISFVSLLSLFQVAGDKEEISMAEVSPSSCISSSVSALFGLG